jgi:hypothetical protein
MFAVGHQHLPDSGLFDVLAAWMRRDVDRVLDSPHRQLKADIDAALDAAEACCRAGIHPVPGRTRDAWGERCGACGRRVRP